MMRAVIHDLPDWRVISYGNGLSYALAHVPSGKDIFFQGDDADEFRDTLETLTEGTPSLDYADAFAVIWSDYADAAQPVEN